MKALSKPFHLAGVKFTDAHTLVLRPSDTLVDVYHNPTNAFDPFALDAYINSTRVGFIPRTEQARWFYHTMRSVPVRCRLISFDKNRPPYEQIEVVFECGDMYSTEVVKQGGVANK